MSTENQYHLQAPGCFSRILGNRDTATAVTSMGRAAGVLTDDNQSAGLDRNESEFWAARTGVINYRPYLSPSVSLCGYCTWVKLVLLFSKYCISVCFE